MASLHRWNGTRRGFADQEDNYLFHAQIAMRLAAGRMKGYLHSTTSHRVRDGFRRVLIYFLPIDGGAM